MIFVTYLHEKPQTFNHDNLIVIHLSETAGQGAFS